MRLLTATLVLYLATIPAWAAESSWTGAWDTLWRDGGARMDLQQAGGTVRATMWLHPSTVSGVRGGLGASGCTRPAPILFRIVSGRCSL